MKTEIRKYILYGAGEILLIIIGILIALQIDNWNTERQQEALLSTYLHSIAGNMRDDAAEIAVLRDIRSARVLDAARASQFMGFPDYHYDVAELYFFNKVAAEAGENLYFNSDTSGYEALKNSGVSGRLQGRDLEQLLSKYYDQVSHIEDLEDRLNGMLNTLNMEFLLSHLDNQSQWEFREPRAVSTNRLRELQPEFRRIINNAAIREMVGMQIQASSIIREYHRLETLGEAFVTLLESGRSSLAEQEAVSVLKGGGATDPALYASLVRDGQISAQFYLPQTVADNFESVFTFRSFEKTGDSLRFVFPGSESWAAIWFGVIDTQEDRPALDYSGFDKLVLELKADSGSDIVNVHFKDRFLPDDRAPESVDIQITDSWQRYEIDLGNFGNTDFSKLITPLGFTFLRDPQSFLMRSAHYEVAD